MGGIKEIFEILLGKEFVDEMATRLLIILGSLAVAVLIVVAFSIWKGVACGKVKKAILSLSEHPDDQQAERFTAEIDKVSSVGRFFAKHSKEYSGLSKGDCRTIYNSTVLASNRISVDNKKAIRDCLMKFGCTGLTDVDSIS